MSMETQYSSSNPYTSAMKMAAPPSQHADNDRGTAELCAMDCNLTSLCDHIQIEGFNSGAFSDIVVHSMASTYRLHRLILSRSSYFRNMLHGPWKEAGAPVLTLIVDDKNVNGEAIAMALAYLYGHHPKLNDDNAFRVLAAASFLDLQDLCVICTDFIIAELWTSNFLVYQVFAESQDYGIHGERVRNACWGYLCQSGSMELKEVLPKLSSQTLYALLSSDELWVSSEERRFELALLTFLAKGVHCKEEPSESGCSSSEAENSKAQENPSIDSTNERLESELGHLSLNDGLEVHKGAHGVVDFQTVTSISEQKMQQATFSQSSLEPPFLCNVQGSSSSNNSFSDTNGVLNSCSYISLPITVGVSGLSASGVAMEGPSEEGCYQLDSNTWLARDQASLCSSVNSSANGLPTNDWGRCGMPAVSCGGRVAGRRQLKSYAKSNLGARGEDYDVFDSLFEGRSLMYCNMTFEALLNMRKQLEQLGFPCKAVNDGLWLQMLLRQRVQEIVADTCKNCCLTSLACACRQPFAYARGVNASGYYDQNSSPGIVGNIYVAESSQGEGNGPQHVRGPIEGLAGIGRGANFVPASAWPPTRFVYSRVPIGVGNRNCHQSLANDDSEARAEHSGDVSGDGLTALVGLSQGGSGSMNAQGEPTERGYEMELQSRISGTSVAGPSATGIPVQMLQAPDHALGIEWENENSTITLDMKTPLSHFPPFRFGHREFLLCNLSCFEHRESTQKWVPASCVQFEDVHRLNDGQVKHSPEFFYAGSLWKVSAQAFNDEDPQGRRTLGLFLHRRKAEMSDSLRKVHLFVDSREKVTARYQLICPSKREVMVFGNFKQTGTLLPKAPKGWGWRTALLFDELADFLQHGALRVAAVVQIV